tara:strand:- start:3382 stop:4635 length:1254 start_codon:yes stop_codon:yes gene_type:complete
MSSSKISPILPLSIGAVFIAVAAIGLAISVIGSDDEEAIDSPPRVVADVQGDLSSDSGAEPDKPEEVIAVEAPSEEELRRQLVRILLGRISQTDRDFNSAWLQKTHQFIKTPEDLRAFWDEYLKIGRTRSELMARAQAHSKKRLPQDPRYFVSQANATLTEKDNTEFMLQKGVEENMALALFKKQEETEGVQNIEESFMGGFYDKILDMYHLLEKRAVNQGKDTKRLMDERVRTLEAAIYDRHMRIENTKKMARTKKEGTGQSVASELVRTDQMNKEVNSHMLALGQVYFDGAIAEVIDREKHKYYADKAFKTLAMVYKRSRSGEALNLMREVNNIQRDYLHRLAKVNWKRAQIAAASNDIERADEGYYVATQRYLQAMGQSVEGRRELIAREFFILKEEIAKWQAQKTLPTATYGG